MQFTIKKTDLKSAVKLAVKALHSRPAIPVLECLLFSVESDLLTITGTDLEVFISIDCPISGKGEKTDFCIDGKQIEKIVDNIETTDFTFEIGSHFILIKSDMGNFNVPYLSDDVETFPIAPVANNSVLAVGNDVFRSVISNNIFAVSTDDLRPAMTGLFLDIKTDKVVVAVTDAHRLCVETFDASITQDNTSLILPKKFCKIVEAIKGNDIAELLSGENIFMYDCDNIRVSFRGIDARYPDYNCIVPKTNQETGVLYNHVARFNRNDLIKAVKAASIMADSTTNRIKLVFTASGECTIVAENLDFSTDSLVPVKCEYQILAPFEFIVPDLDKPINSEGNYVMLGTHEWIIGVNSKFLMESLLNIVSDMVEIGMSTANRAMVLKDGENRFNLVMPVMINN
jgi:DNA polymerase-3 subunit beta